MALEDGMEVHHVVEARVGHLVLDVGIDVENDG